MDLKSNSKNKAPQYSAAAHLIHSRLQLIRHRLDIKKDAQAASMVWQYRKILDKAAESVLIQHGINSEYKDIFDACELLYNSFHPPLSPATIRYSVLAWRSEPDGFAIELSGWDEQGNIIPADPSERLTQFQANEKLLLIQNGRPGFFTILNKYEEPLIAGDD